MRKKTGFIDSGVRPNCAYYGQLTVHFHLGLTQCGCINEVVQRGTNKPTVLNFSLCVNYFDWQYKTLGSIRQWESFQVGKKYRTLEAGWYQNSSMNSSAFGYDNRDEEAYLFQRWRFALESPGLVMIRSFPAIQTLK